LWEIYNLALEWLLWNKLLFTFGTINYLLQVEKEDQFALQEVHSGGGGPNMKGIMLLN